MEISLYRPFPDPWRQSMRVYADQLHAHLLRLPSVESGADRLMSRSLPDARLEPPFRYWDQYVRYQRVARKTRADVHHILDHGFAHLAGAAPRGGAVVTFHDAMPLRSGGASLGTRKMLDMGMRTAVSRGAHFIAVSRTSAQDAQEFFGVPASSISIVPNGVDERFRPPVDRAQIRARLGLTRPTVLIVGHTHAYMNVEGALAAAASARRSVDLDVVKIGAPLTTAQGSRAAALGLTGHLKELGIVSDTTLLDWYSAADALVYLPRFSGFGLPVLEAMATGLPVVASSAGAVREIAERAAALASPDDPDAAGLALSRILTDDVYRLELTRHGLARALDYTWRASAERVMDVYRKVANAAA